MQPNHLIAIVGVVLIATSVAGLIVIEESRPGEGYNWHLKTFGLQFPITQAEVSGSGTTADSSSDSVTLRISERNLTEATLNFNWVDNRPLLSRTAATVTVGYNGPQGQTGSDSSDSGSITFELGGLNSAPNETEVEAETAEEAVESGYELNPPTTEGTGDWEITVSVERQGFLPRPRPGSVDWVIVIDFSSYEMVVIALDEDPTAETSDMGVSS